METLLIVGLILVLLGVIGSVVPAMPGPIFSFIGLVILYLSSGPEVISLSTLIWFGVVMIILSAADYVAPIMGAKYAGASRRGFWGAVLGALVGIVLLPPLGILLGALIGAVVGEMSSGKKIRLAFKAAMGVVLGGVLMIALQTLYAIFVAIYFFTKVY